MLVTFVSFVISNATAADFYDIAHVVSSTPVLKSNKQKYICDDNPAYFNQPKNDTNATGVIVGGVAGAIVGNQVGRGNGKVAATAVGAVVGALSGNTIANKNDNQNRPAKRQCQWFDDGSQTIVGYDVTYEYNGKTAMVRMRNEPVNTIRIAISAVPY